ncbi:MAG: PIN domain-containing protein [Nitrososphaerales archaeon]
MIVLDTSFIVSYFNERDENHTKATELMESVANLMFGPIYMTNFIFDETVTVSFIRLKNITKAVEIGNYLLKSLRIIEVEKTNFYKAWEIFRRQKTTDLSFTDCTTISVMQDNEIKNIATFDEDFKGIKGINVISS